MYTLSTIADIQRTSKYMLPMDIKQKIQSLCKQVGTEVPFTIVQETTTIKDSLRELNKMTEDNKEEKFKLICSILQQHEEELPSFAPVLFHSLCRQTFFSKLYADLFLVLQKWPCFQEAFQTQYQLYKTSFSNVHTCSPDDYDEYCRLKKENQERRDFSLFLVHCIQNGSVSNTYYEETMDTLVQCIETTLSIDQKEVMNEYIENLYILVMTMKQIHPIVEKLTTLKPKEYPGLNHKMIFRCMDIIV